MLRSTGAAGWRPLVVPAILTAASVSRRPAGLPDIPRATPRHQPFGSGDTDRARRPGIAPDRVDSRTQDIGTASISDDFESQLTDVTGAVEELESDLSDVWHGIDSAYLDANSATEDLLFELQLACP
jgi:hypothetical protein